MRVVVDVNLPPAWASRLRVYGHDAQHWSEIGALDATDSEILAWAADHQAVVLTCDLDFGAILAASQARTPSVVQIRARDVLPEAIGERICEVLKTAGPISSRAPSSRSTLTWRGYGFSRSAAVSRRRGATISMVRRPGSDW